MCGVNSSIIAAVQSTSDFYPWLLMPRTRHSFQNELQSRVQCALKKQNVIAHKPCTIIQVCKQHTCKSFQEVPLFTQVDPTKIKIVKMSHGFQHLHKIRLTVCLFQLQLGMYQSDQNKDFEPERERERKRMTVRDTATENHKYTLTTCYSFHTWYLCSSSMVLKFLSFLKSHSLTTESSAAVAR